MRSPPPKANCYRHDAVRGDPKILRAPELPHMNVENIEESGIFIDGERIRGATRKTFDNTNPPDTRDVIGQFRACCAADARVTVRSAAKD